MTFLAIISAIRRYWKLAALGALALLLAVQTLRLGAANNRADRIQINLNEARAELKRISTAKNEQAKTTERNIRESEKRIHISDKIADKIEAAPLPGNCRTPGAILGADL